jgi:hypothetical protein
MELELRIIDEFADCYALSQMPEAVRKSVQKERRRRIIIAGRQGRGSLAMMELARLAADAGN